MPNEFFIWVAIKFLSNYNLELFLTKYYKKKLKFWLKNRKIYIHTYITSAKRTDIYQLNLQTNLKTWYKSFGLRRNLYTLFTSSFSLIPTPLLILNSISIYCFYLLSHFSPTFQLNSSAKTSNYTKNNLVLASSIAKSSVKNIEEKISMFTNFNTLKKYI